MRLQDKLQEVKAVQADIRKEKGAFIKAREKLTKKFKKARQKHSDALYELEQERARNRTSTNKVRTDFILSLVMKFLDLVRSNRHSRELYINGGFTCEFTKFISRRGMSGAINREHREAIIAFTKAKQNLNRVFLMELESQAEEGSYYLREAVSKWVIDSQRIEKAAEKQEKQVEEAKTFASRRKEWYE